MKPRRTMVLLAAFLALAGWSWPSVCIAGSADGPHASVHALIERIIPGKTSKFQLEDIPAENGMEVFELECRGGKIILRGSSDLACARAFNWYLNHYCHTSVSWYLCEPVDVPSALPKFDGKIRKACRFEKRFFLNYCTFGYTMLWWQWDDWQRFIDWMALNGINMPLAITGQEYVWEKVWQQFGLTPDQIRAFFTGPSHLPWHRMGNLDGWQGPLPQDFIDHQFALQKQILARERSFGMTPILPAFAGHVPKAIMDSHPGTKITSLGSYTVGDQYNAYFLDPLEPLFIQIQKAFLKEQTELFGTDHLYGADPFNEMDPPSWETNYLANVSGTIYRGMSAVDPDAVWVQMGWTFYADSEHWTAPRLSSMIKAVPEGKMVLLDYFCEEAELWRTTGGFYGSPYIWCYLGNFGGNTQMAAPIRKVAGELTAAESDPGKGKLYGIGSTLEGFGVNRFMFEWLFEYAWDSDAAHVDDWLRQYAQTRTGRPDPIAENAWKRLADVVYTTNVSRCGLGNMLQSRPDLTKSGHYTRFNKYNYSELADVLGQMLLADPKSLKNPRYQYDVQMVGRQVLGNLSLGVRDKITEAYTNHNQAQLDFYTGLFLGLETDVDRLQATRPEWLLGRWVAGARAFGKTPASKHYYETDAKVLITTWGGRDSEILDYAARDYSGLLATYYKPRWEQFFDKLKTTPYDGNTTNLMTQFNSHIADFEWDWVQRDQNFSTQPEGDTIAVTRELYRKYLPYLHGL